jgi:hypothetical protein
MFVMSILITSNLMFLTVAGPAPEIREPGPSSDIPDTSGWEQFLIMGVSQKDLEDLKVEVIDGYESFVHIRAPSETMAVLEGLDMDIRPLPYLNIISFDTVTFDTREGEPEIPALLRDDGTDLFIVQLRGPTKSEWIECLSLYGHVLDIVQYHAYIMRIDPSKVDMVSDLEFVSWVGHYHPYYKVRSGFEGLDQQVTTKATVIFFKDDPEAYQWALDKVLDIGGRVLYTDDITDWWNGARIEIPVSSLGLLARSGGLNFIEPYDDPTSRMNNVRWVVQSYDADDRTTTIWDHGINGTGIIVGGADTGIDYSHVAFRNSTGDVGAPSPEHRKVVRYNTTVDAWDDSSGHGTHTMGAIVGNNVSDGSGDFYLDGIAFEAQVAFYDVVLPNGIYDPPIITDILQDSYDFGAKSHSDSWGDDTTAYTARSQRIDQFQWDHYEFLTFIAPGNGGVVWEPATAKNCVSVGNGFNGETKDIASSSAVGPANGNMINPHVIAPGMNIHSPDGDLNHTNNNEGYSPLSGTSMSTPVAAGTTALIEQYFKDGFYPSGTKVSGDGFEPSGPLKKAALINSAWDQYGGTKGGSNIGHAPNNQQGWGKIKLDDVLYFDGDSRNLWIYDGYNPSAGQGLSTGQKDTFILHANSSDPFEVSLVWNDYPGQGLKNDLDLTVLSPKGELYRGNRYVNGESAPDGVADGSNPTETVLLKEPESGFYLINITAINIQSQVHQRYSLVVTGSIQSSKFGDVNFDKDLYGIKEKVGIRVVDSDLAGQGGVEVTVSSLTETSPETIMLSESGNQGIFYGSIDISLETPSNDGALQVVHNDTIAVAYTEDDPAGTRVDVAKVDAQAPIISNLKVTEITTSSALVTWDTDEPADGNITYGPSQALGSSVHNSSYTTAHSFRLTGLLQSTLYYFDVSSSDRVGNVRVEDNDGMHHTFRTASFIMKVDPGYVGWVREGEGYNHFTDGMMYSGYFSSKKRDAAMLFNLSGVPDNADVVSATVRLYGRSRVGMDPTQGTWSLEMLASSVNPKFNGTTTGPIYTDIAAAPVDATIGQRENQALIEDQWTIFDVSQDHLDLIEDRLSIDSIAFRVRGPQGGDDNMFAWDTGHPDATNSLGTAYGPQLIITVNLIPMVSTNAPTDIEMDEDSTYVLDLGTIFTDDGPLEYTILRNPENFKNETIENGTLNLTPVDDWNGEEYVVIKAMDNDLLSSEHRINITVKPINDPPRLVTIDGRPVQDGMVIEGLQEELISIPVTVSDVDIDIEGDLWFLSTNVSWLDPNGTNLTFLPTNDDVGTHEVQVMVKDLANADDRVNIILDIENVNDPPVAIIYKPMEGFEAYTDAPVVLNASPSFDIDEIHGDVITYVWRSNLTSGDLGIDEVLKANLTAGDHKITLMVSDVDGATDFAEVNITIWGDTDGDGYFDPEDPDDDGDGMPDYWEETYGLDPLDMNDANQDLDLDKASNLKEYQANTDPTDPKSRPKTTSGTSDAWTALLIFLLIFLISIVVAILYNHATRDRTPPERKGRWDQDGTTRGRRRKRKVRKVVEEE